MRKKIYTWLGREFIALSGEGREGKPATEETVGLFRRIDEELRGHGLSLANTVRTRLWGKDREGRDLGSQERVKALSGKARSVSSSYISPVHFDSNAHVAMDLLAMRTAKPGIEKILKEYDPPITPLRYCIYDSIVFLSGVSAVLPNLSDQIADILPRISDSLRDAGTSWGKAVKVSFFLHRSQKIETLRDLFRKTVDTEIQRIECSFVDGYSAPGKLIEIEVTAQS